MNTTSHNQNPQIPEKTGFWSSLLKPLLRRLGGVSGLFDRMRWKLTFSYTLVSVVLILVIIVLSTVGAILFSSQFYFPNIPPKMAEQAALIAPYFSEEDSKQENLTAWLATQKRYVISSGFDDDSMESELNLNNTNRLHILDVEKRLLGSSDVLLTGTGLELNQTEQTILDSVLAGEREQQLDITRWFPIRVFSSVPIMLDDDALNNRVVGSIVLTQDYKVFGEGLSFLLFCLVIITLLAMLVGTIFGFIHSRGLTQRLTQVEHATSAWRQGDFTSRVDDPSRDELGRLTTRLNEMAEDLANHVNTRQELAMLEERNRLALELHDSVKQQVFAIGMKLGFAESLATNEELKKTLYDLGELAHQTQDELERMIHELKPVALEQQGLQSALEGYVRSWADLHDVKVSRKLEFTERLPSQVEQALFRVAQESLANIAKHAQAKQIDFRLYQADDTVVLSIEDDGSGFNTNETTSGLGRQSMFERMSQLGGTINISSEEGQGTQIEARIEARLALEGDTV